MNDKAKKPNAMSPEETLATLNRQMPFSDEAEKGVLSCVLQDPVNRLPEIEGKLPAESFYHSANQIVIEELLEMWRTQQPVDPVTLTHRLRDRALLDKVGGAAMISELFAFVPIPAHFPFYTKIVEQKWRLRRLIGACAEITHGAFEHGKEMQEQSVTELITHAESLVFAELESAQKSGQHGKGAQPARVAILDWVDHMEVVMNNQGKLLGLPTGLHELDMAFHGLDDHEGEICTIAARPSMGKSSMARTIADFLAVEKRIPGVIFSIEESFNQWMGKQILGGAGINTSKAITGHFSGERNPPTGEYRAWQERAALVAKSPLFINADSALTTADLRSQVQVLKRQQNIRWIMVDHLHLVKSTDPEIQKDERRRLVEVMETLQYLKKEHKIVIFLMVQMNRDSDKNPGKPPVLSDLSGSAAIEQYSDQVVFIHREDFYQKWHRLSEDAKDAWREQIMPRRERSPELWSDGLKYEADDGGFARQDWEEKAMLYVRKNRRGPTPEVQVRFQGEYTRFSTRMPCLNSNDPRDWQMGSYVPKVSRTGAMKAGECLQKKNGWKPKAAGGETWHADFTGGDDDQPDLSERLRGGYRG